MSAGRCANCGNATIWTILANCWHQAYACGSCLDRHQGPGSCIENCLDCSVPDELKDGTKDDDEHPLSLALNSAQYYQLTAHIREMAAAYEMTETDFVRFLVESHYEKFVTPPSKAFVGNIYRKWLTAWDGVK